jgi:hypothetical protein
MPRLLVRVTAAVLAALALAPAGASAQNIGPDYVTSDNVELIGRLKQAGDGVGARIVGNIMYVTSTTHLTVFDITNAESPAMLGALTMDVEFENEDVPTNGKVLGISASIGCETVTLVTNPGTTNCLNLYDVSNPAAPKFVKAVPGAGDHTQECVLDCTWFYGSEGTIVDARNIADAKIVDAQWDTIMEEKTGVEMTEGGHDVTEVAPGILVSSTAPLYMMSVLPEHGGSPESPAPIAIGDSERFIHSVEWPRKGRDRWLLVGGETVLSPNYVRCSDVAAPFMTYDAKNVINPNGGWNFKSKFTLVDEIRPVSGNYVDGNAPASVFGCSTHWFKEHPTFKNGGLVAVGQYEDGVRFFQVGEDGKLTEQGYFLPLGGATSAAHWHPNGKVVYSIDYERGVDILRYTGETYVPGNAPDPSAKPGTNGAPPPTVDQPECASAAGFRDVKANPSGKTVRFTTQRRQTKPFTVDIFQQSQGSKVVKERLVAKFSNKTEDFVWNGTDRKKRKLKDGRYFARFTMKLDSGAKDVRRVTLNRKGGRFSNAPDFFQRVDCGIFSKLKLTSSVFGGSTKEPIKLSYRLDRPVQAVNIEVRSGGKTIKKFTGKGQSGKTFSFTLKHTAVKKNKEAEFIVTVNRGGESSPTYTLRAKRL